MKLPCILMSNSHTVGAGNLICFWVWRQVGMLYTGATTWQPRYFALTVPMKSHRNKITMPEVKHNGSDRFERLTILWLPWPVLPASVMIWRWTPEQLAETIIGNELLAVRCDMQFNNSDGSSSPSPSPARLTSARGELCLGPGMESTTWGNQWWEPAGASGGKCQLQKVNSVMLVCILPWVSTAWMSLNFSSTPPWLAWQQDTSLNCLKGQGGGEIRPCRLMLWKMTRDFCCLASHTSDTYAVQKEHLPFKLLQRAENIKASVIFSFL